MPGTASIFRIDATGDTEADAVTANQIVEFNTGAVNPDSRSHLSSVKLKMIEDVAIHPNPNRHLSRVSDSKLGTIEYTITGYFDRPAAATGITRFFNWMIQDKTNSDLDFGRFGIRVDNMSQVDLTPSGTIGLILVDFEVADIDEFQSHAPFTARLLRSGSV